MESPYLDADLAANALAGRAGPVLRRLEPLLVAAFAFWVAWHFGHRGFMPLDHSVVFDGGWRILSGQVPWRDFLLPSFLTPSAIQAVFFGLFGVSWSSFVLHAALFNLVFALVSRDLVLRLGGGRTAGALCGLLAALLFYPPVGVPFADQHAFGFSLLAIWTAVAARGHGRPGRREARTLRRNMLLWAVTPLLILAAFLSKQLPSVLVPLVVLFVAAAPGPRPRREALDGLLVSLGVLLVTVLLLGALLASAVDGGDISSVGYALFELPMGEAEQRRAYMPSGLGLVERVLGAGGSVGAVRLAWLHLALVAATALAFWTRRKREDPGSLVPGWTALALGLGLLLLGQVTMVLANNQDAAAAAFAVPGLGLVLAATGCVSGPTRHGLVALAFVLMVIEPLHWFGDVMARSTNDMSFDPELAVVLSDEDSEVLAGLHYQTPEHHAIPWADLCQLVDVLEERAGDFFLVGDTAVLYAMAGKRSVLPSLWYHPGVTIPPAGSAAFDAWQGRLADQVADGRIARVVVEREGTWIRNWTLADLPRVRRAVVERGYEEQQHGVFRLLELAPLSAD